MRKRIVALLAAVLCLTMCACSSESNYYTNYGADKLYTERCAELLPNVAELKYGASSATGFVYTVYDGAPILVTNYHLFGTDIIDETALGIRFDGEDTFRTDSAEPVAFDRGYDLAFFRLKFTPPRETIDLRATISDSVMGASVLAIGNAAGEGLAAFDGIVSAAERLVTVDNTLRVAVQTTAAINGGSSGCPLVSLDGGLLGVGFAQKITMDNERPVQDMNYAVPARIVEQAFKLAVWHNDGKQLPFVTTRVQLSQNDRTNEVTATVPSLAFAAMFKNGKLTVTAVTDATITNLRVGNVIVSIGGLEIDGYVSLIAAMYATSNLNATPEFIIQT